MASASLSRNVGDQRQTSLTIKVRSTGIQQDSHRAEGNANKVCQRVTCSRKMGGDSRLYKMTRHSSCYDSYELV